MKIKLFISALVLMAILGGTVYAHPSHYVHRWRRQPEFTETQIGELNDIWEQMQTLRDCMMEKMNGFGVISPERQWIKGGWRLQQEGQDEPQVGYGPCHGARTRIMQHRRMMGSWGM